MKRSIAAFCLFSVTITAIALGGPSDRLVMSKSEVNHYLHLVQWAVNGLYGGDIPAGSQILDLEGFLGQGNGPDVRWAQIFFKTPTGLVFYSVAIANADFFVADYTYVLMTYDRSAFVAEMKKSLGGVGVRVNKVNDEFKTLATRHQKESGWVMNSDDSTKTADAIAREVKRQQKPFAQILDVELSGHWPAVEDPKDELMKSLHVTVIGRYTNGHYGAWMFELNKDFTYNEWMSHQIGTQTPIHLNEAAFLQSANQITRM
jgi:hypothetical protein